MSDHDLHFRYTPGSMTGVCGGDVAALVGLPPDHELVRGVLALLQDERPHLDDVLEVLTSQGLRAVTDFAVAELMPEGVRVVVRGANQATTSSGQTVSGAGLWVDRIIEGDKGVRLAGGEVHGSYLMPVGVGIVLAGVVEAGSMDAPEKPEQLEQPALAPAATQLDEPEQQPALESAPAEPHEEPAADATVSEEADTTLDEPEESPADETVTEPEEPEASEPDEEVPSFDHLFGATQAMRPDQMPPPEPEPEVEAAPEPVAPEPEKPESGATLPTPMTTPVPPPPPASSTPATGGFIDFFPWAEDGTPLPHPQSGSSAPEAPAQEPAPAQPSGQNQMTVNRDQIRSTGAPLVVAARCPQGHLSPAYAGTCRVCRQPLPPQQPFEVERPPLGVLRLSNGETVVLDRGAVLGRNPHLPPDWSGEQPNLIRLSDPNRDISSQHLEVRLDFWHVLVRDLGSTNGTDVILPGSDPVALRPMDAMTIEPGTRVILAGVFEFTYEV